MSGDGQRVVVMGGSLGGLTAALFLRDAGCDVEVHERSRVPLEGQGAGIVLNPATVRYFTEHGGLDLDEISVPARGVRYLDDKGTVADESSTPYRFTSYNALYRRLLEAFGTERYYLASAVESFQQHPDRVDVRVSELGVRPCELLVCADGIRSGARAQLVPDAQPVYAGYVAWRGTVAPERLTAPTRSALREAITYRILPHGHLLTYPIPAPGVAPGGQYVVNWLWYVNVEAGEALDEIMTDGDGVRRVGSLPPGAAAPEPLRRLRAAAGDALPPPLVELVHGTERPFVQVVFDLEVPRMAFGRACLLGDAAFACRPHAAAGSAKAAEDGYQLSEAIRDSHGDVLNALRRWEPRQIELARAVLKRTREAGQRSQFDGTWRVGDPLPFGLHEVGDSVMATA